MRRVWIAIESDDRFRLDRQSGAGGAVVIEGRDVDRESLARAYRPIGRGQLDLELRRDKILYSELDRADRRRLWVEIELDAPRADPRITRDGEGLPIPAQLIAGELPLLDGDTIRPQQSQ